VASGWKLLGCCFFRGGLGGSGLGSFCLYSFSHNLHLDLRSDFAMQLDGYVEVAHALERLRQLDLAAIDLEAVRREPGGNVGRGDGSRRGDRLRPTCG